MCILLFYFGLGLLLSGLSYSLRLVISWVTDYGFDMLCDAVISYCSLSPAHLTSLWASCHDMPLLGIHIFFSSFFIGYSSFVCNDKIHTCLVQKRVRSREGMIFISWQAPTKYSDFIKFVSFKSHRNSLGQENILFHFTDRNTEAWGDQVMLLKGTQLVNGGARTQALLWLQSSCSYLSTSHYFKNILCYFLPEFLTTCFWFVSFTTIYCSVYTTLNLSLFPL